MVNVGSATASLILDTSKFMSGLQTANTQFQGMKNNFTTVGASLQSAGAAMANTGKKITAGITLPVVGATAAITKISVDFEKQMSRVQAIAGLPADAMVRIEQKAREMGESTIYSATEAGKAFEYMALAGWKEEEMLRGIEPILKLAGAAQMDLGTASDIVTDGLTAFGLSADDANNFVDVLAATMANSNTDVNQLGEAFKYVAQMGGTMSYSIEDVSLALGTMANAGVKSSQSGTALRRLLINMVNPTDQVQVAMSNLGVKLFDAEGKARPLRSVLEDLRKSLLQGGGDTDAFRKGVSVLSQQLEDGVITEEQYDQGLKDLAKSSGVVTDQFKLQNIEAISGAIGMSGLAAIVGSSEEDWKRLSGAIDNSNGSASQMYDTMTNNLWGSFEELKSKAMDLAIEFGEVLIPILKDLLEWLKGIVDWFRNLTVEQQEGILKTGLFVAALGPLLSITGGVTKGIGGIVNIIGSFIGNRGGGGVLGATGAIGQLETSLSASGTMFGGFKTAATTLGVGAVNLFKTAVGGIGSVVKTAGGAIGGLAKTAFGGLTTAISGAIGGGGLAGGITGFLGILSNPLTLGIGAAVGGITLLVTNWDNIKEAVGKAGKAIADWASNGIETFKNWASNVGKTVGDWVSNVGEWFSQVPKKAGEFFGNAFNTIKEWGGNVANTIKEVGGNVVKGVGDFFGQIPEKVGSFFGNAFDTIKSWGGNIINTLSDTGTKFVSGIGDFFGQVPEKIGNFFGNAFDKVKDFGTNVVNKAAEMGKGFVDNVTNFFGQIPEKVGGFFNKAVEIGGNIVGGIAQGLQSAGSAIWNGITTVGNTIVDGFKNFFGIHSPSTLMNKVIGIFLPPGIANGFISAMPKATNEMQKSLNKNIDKLSTDDIEVKPKIEIEEDLNDYSKSLEFVYNKVSDWFVGVEDKISNSIKSMIDNLTKLIDLGKEIQLPNDSFEDIFGLFKKDTMQGTVNTIDEVKKTGDSIVNNFTFYSPEAIDEIEASRLMKKTAQDIAEGFVF